MNKDYTIYLISNKEQYYENLKKSILPDTLNYFDGTNAESFSQLINKCVDQCPTETIIIMSDKVMPNKTHIDKMLELIEAGYAFVGLYRFGFFGFKKELFRQIGMMDERYLGGGYEDNDMYIRLKEANLSVYLSQEVPYQKRQSGWGYVYTNPSAEFFKEKWNNNSTKFKLVIEVYRTLAEENYLYNLGSHVSTEFMPWEKSSIKLNKLNNLHRLHIGKKNEF